MSDRYISDILFLGSHFIMFGLYPWYLLICLVLPGNLCLKSCWISMSLCCILLSWIRCIYSAIKALCICPFIFCRRVRGSCRVCHWKMCLGSPRCSSSWKFSWKNLAACYLYHNFLPRLIGTQASRGMSSRCPVFWGFACGLSWIWWFFWVGSLWR